MSKLLSVLVAGLFAAGAFAQTPAPAAPAAPVKPAVAAATTAATPATPATPAAKAEAKAETPKKEHKVAKTTHKKVAKKKVPMKEVSKG